jgi:hypothetical protein
MKYFVWGRVWQTEVGQVTLIQYAVAICMLRTIILNITWTTQRQNKACLLERHKVDGWKSNENFKCLVFGFYKD